MFVDGDENQSAAAAAGTSESASESTSTPTDATPSVEPTQAAESSAAEQADPQQGDPGDEQPLEVAKDAVTLQVKFSEFEPFAHVMVPNSTPLKRSLAAVIKAKELADLDSLEATGTIRVLVNGAEVDANKSSLELGLNDGNAVTILTE